MRSSSQGQNLQGGSSWFYSDKYWQYNAAGKMSRWEEEGPWGEETRRGGESTFDGDGRPVKHAELKRTRTNDDWGAWESTMEWYYLYSSVTGQKVNDIFDGLYAGSLVHLGDSVIHDDTYKGPYWGSTDPPQEHSWGFTTTDPITGSTHEMLPDGTVAARNELAGLGTSIPSQAPQTPYPPNPHRGSYAGNSDCIIQWDGFDIGGAHCGPLELAGADGYTDFVYVSRPDHYPPIRSISLWHEYGGGQSGTMVGFKDNADARSALEQTLRGHCGEMVELMFDYLTEERKLGYDNWRRDGSVLDNFDELARQKKGGFFFDGSHVSPGRAGETTAELKGKDWAQGTYMFVGVAPVPLSFLDAYTRKPGKRLSPKAIAEARASKRASLIGTLIHEIAHAAAKNQPFSHTALDNAAKAVDRDLENEDLDTDGGQRSPYFNKFLEKHCGLKQDVYGKN